MPDLSEFNLSVGGRDGLTQTLNGEIKLFSLFKTAKSDNEILELYNLGPDLGGLELKADGTLFDPNSDSKKITLNYYNPLLRETYKKRFQNTVNALRKYGMNI